MSRIFSTAWHTERAEAAEAMAAVKQAEGDTEMAREWTEHARQERERAAEATRAGNQD